MHELGVADAIDAAASVDTGDPELADLALLRATIAVLVHQGVTYLLLSLTVAARTGTEVALGHFKSATTLLLSIERTLNASHS